MPSISRGFWVARTKKGSGSGWVCPPAVTVRSCIASSSALWVRGVARLISSASSRLVKMGPGAKRKLPVSRSKIWVPVMSPGIRSGVNWTRPKLEPRHLAESPYQQRLARGPAPPPAARGRRPPAP